MGESKKLEDYNSAFECVPSYIRGTPDISKKFNDRIPEREREEGRIWGFQFPGEGAGVRALNAIAFQVKAKATSSGLSRIQLTPSFLVTPTGPLSVPLPPPLIEIDSRVEEAFPGTAFLMVISPQHHLPAAAAPARCAARGPRGPETRRRAGSRRASQAQLRKDWIVSLHVRKPFGLAWTPASPHPLHTPPIQGSLLSPFACNSKRSSPPPA
ncbi:uncharacterized protein LOC125121921 [Phacochoerus africanus]|uniref:uncharacterized protein LOC125121921 n=1 Tax=Phacochoerus africanus TaxID=41426 RepID=UPI001FD93515|nr:uncharacterized protein LOC125121921 [Phacochoerus africanus]